MVNLASHTSIGIDTSRVNDELARYVRPVGVEPAIPTRSCSTASMLCVRPISSPSGCSSLLEGLLSADNAMVLAVLVLGLPQRPAAEGAALRHPRRVRLPRDRDAAGGLPDPARLGEAGRRGVPAVSAVPALLPAAASGEERRAPPPATAVARAVARSGRRSSRSSSPTSSSRSTRSSSAVAMSPKLWVDPDRRHPRHRRDAAGDRAAARRSSSATRRSWTARSSSSRGSASSC